MPLGYFTDSTPLTPIRNPFNVLVDGINANETAISDAEDVRQIQTFRWADASERAAQTGMVAGDVGYQVDTTTPYRYDGSAWSIDGGGMFCVLGKSANQSLTTSLSPVSWDVEISDDYAMHSNTPNDTRVTAPVAGTYEVTVFVYNNNTAGTGVIQARKNGTIDIRGSFTRRTATPDAAIPLDKTFPVALDAGDYIEIMVSHSTAAGTISGGTTTGSSVLTVKRLG